MYRGRARFCHNRAMTERSSFDTGPPDEGTGDLLATSGIGDLSLVFRHWDSPGSTLANTAIISQVARRGLPRRDDLDGRSRGQTQSPESLVPGTCTVISARMDYLPSGEHRKRCWPMLKRLMSRGMPWAVTITK